MKTASIINDVGIPRLKPKITEEPGMKPPKLLRTVAFSILTFLFAVAMGVTTSMAQVYITPDGDDTNGDGTQNNPYATLTTAVSEANNGDTIYIGGGSYDEGVAGATAVSIDTDKSLTFQTYTHAGTVVATFVDNITFEGGTEITGNLSAATLEFTGATTIDDATLSFNGQYISVEGLTITADGTFNASGSSFSPGGDLNIAGTLALDSGTLLRLTGQDVQGTGDIGEGGEISISSGTVNLTGNTTFAGDLTLNESGALDLNATTLTLLGDFENIQGSTFTGATGTLAFAGGAAQEFFPRQLEVYNLSVTGANTELTTRTTLRVNNDITIGADAHVNLGESGDAAVHIRMLGGAGTFDNDGGYTTPTDVAGFIIVDGATTIEGLGTFGNLDVSGATVTANSDINFSGTLYVRDGQTLAIGGNDLSFNEEFVTVSTVNVAGDGNVSGAGKFEVTDDALYDLSVTDETNSTAIDLVQEIAESGVRNLTINADGQTLTYSGNAFTVVGTLNVAAGTTFNPGAINITLPTNGGEHSIGGTINNGAIVVSGDNIAVDGTEDDESVIGNLSVTGDDFSSTDLKSITDITIDAAGASITFNENAGTANDVTITSGDLALDMGDDGRSVNSLDVDEGDLSLGSELAVVTTTSHTDGDITLGSNDLVLQGNYTRDGTGAISGTGFVELAAQLTFNPGVDLSLVNVRITTGDDAAAGANGVTFEANTADDEVLTITGTFEQGTLDPATNGDIENITNAGAGSLTLNINGAEYTYADGYIAGDISFSGTVDLALWSAPTFDAVEVDGNLNLVEQDIDDDGDVEASEAQTVTVGGVFTHTSGNIDLGAGDGAANNDLTLQGNFVHDAGTYTAEDGVLTLEGVSQFTPGTNFSIPNLTITNGAVTVQNANDVEVTSALVLDEDFAGLADDQLVIADDVKITVTNANGTIPLATDVDFGEDISVEYTVVVTAGSELPSEVENLTVGAEVTLPGNFGDLTVDGTITLDAALVYTDADDLIITENASIVENFYVAGPPEEVSVQTAGDVELPNTVESLTLGYTGDETNSQFFGDVSYNNLTIGAAGDITLTAAADELTANVTVNGTLTLGTGTTITGDLSVDGGTFDMDGNALNITGGLALINTPTVNNHDALTFSTSSTADFELDADYTVPAALDITIDKEGGVLTLKGGNLNFANNDLDLNTGALATEGDATIILRHTDFEDAGQGFTRGEGVIAGNVQKPIDWTTYDEEDFERVIFPTGNPDGTYRPITFNFDEGEADRDFNLTVSHVDSSPEGLEGLPAGPAVKYPNFHWTVESNLTIPLTTSYSYQVYLEAEGYEIAALDFTMDDVSLIRRAAGDKTANQWYQTATSYDNELTPEDLPIVRGLDVTQLIRTQKRLLTFGIPSTIRVENEIATTAVNVDQTRSIDISGVFDGTTGEVTYSASSDDSEVVEASVDGTDLMLTGVASGSTTVTVDVTDGTGDTGSVTFDVNVSEALAADVSDQLVNIESEYKVSLYDWFTGGSDSLVFSVVNKHDSVSVPSIVGPSNDSLSVDLVSIGVDTLTITAIDSLAEDTLAVEFELTIGGAFNATGTIADQSIRAADNSNQAAGTVVVDTLANLFAGGTAPFTYTATSSASDTASVTISNDTLYVTAVTGAIDPQPVTITVTAEDSSGATAEQTFDVTVNPAYGDVNADGTVNASDASLILSAAIEETDFTAAQEDAGDVNDNGTVNSFDASVTFRYFLEDITELPFSTSAKVDQALVAFGESASENGTITVPLNVEGSSVYAVDFIGSFDASAASLESVDFAGLPEDWLVVKSTDEEGKVKFALAGSTPISSRQIATVSFKVTDQYAETSFSAKGFANNSEYALDELSLRETPQEFALEQNYPNPFNPTTTVSYKLPSAADVTIELYSINGQKVQTLVSKRQDAGAYTVNVDGSRMASGVYIYRIQAKAENKSFTTTRKMTLIK